jgi:type II secretion system protein H
MSFPRPRAKRREGFQLIELMVVLVILGIVLATALPSFVRRNEWNRLRGEAERLSARMQEARQRAVAQRTPYRMMMDPASLTYRFYREDADTAWVAEPAEYFEAGGVTEIQATLNGDAPFDSVEVLFEPRGTIRDTDVPAVFRFIGAEEDTAILTLVRTGRATMRMSARPED